MKRFIFPLILIGVVSSLAAAAPKQSLTPFAKYPTMKMTREKTPRKAAEIPITSVEDPKGIPFTKSQVYDLIKGKNQFPIYIGYVNISDIRPGQVRYSQRNVDEKMKAALKKGTLKMVDGKYQPQWFWGTSILKEDQALPVIAGPPSVGFVLVDGHHDSISSLQAGAKTIPVKVVANLSALSPRQFWIDAAKCNFIYPYTLAGKRLNQIPAAWGWRAKGNLQDDPNRYFAAITARKCGKSTTPTDESTGANYPLWVKVDKDIPFIEFMMSDALTKAGINYKNEMGDNLDAPPLQEMLEQARTALVANPIAGLKLVPKRIYFKEINGGKICEYTQTIEAMKVPAVPGAECPY